MTRANQLHCLNRRELLSVAVAAGPAAVLHPITLASGQQEQTEKNMRIVDSHVSLFQWPGRRLPLDDVDRLVDKLRSLGIDQAWAGSFEGLLHRDITAVNRRLAAACERHSLLVPFGIINPSLPGWREDLRQCVEQHRMPGIRLYPNYHGYDLSDPQCGQLLEAAQASRLLIQIAASMEDNRTQNSLLQVADVDLQPLPELMKRIGDVRVQILNARPQPALLARLSNSPGLFFDTARVDGTDAIPRLVAALPPGRVLFGSHAPFLIPEAALIRVHESGILDDHGLRAVYSGNAEEALSRGNA